MRALALGASAVLALLPQLQTFHSGVEGIRVDVRVMDGNRPVSGLTASDFEVRDNGVLQHVDAVSVGDVPIAMTLALDLSDSVNGLRLADLKEAARSAVAALGPADRAALLGFSDRTLVRIPFSSDRTAISDAIGNMHADGLTALYDATFAALSLRDDVAARNLVVLFTDGYDTSSWLPATAVLKAARRNDAVVYGVALRNPRKPDPDFDVSAGLLAAEGEEPKRDAFLESLATLSGGSIFLADRTRDLSAHFAAIVKEFQTRYLLTYVPRGVDAKGWHRLDVAVNGRHVTVTARRGYER